VDLLAAWLLYPLVLAALCLGLGLLVERIAGWRVPGALLLPVGFTALLALARLVTAGRETAPYALAVVALLAAAGFALGFTRLRALRPDPWIALSAVGVFAVFAAPVVASGQLSIAGYLALPDTGHQLALAQLFPERGPDYLPLGRGGSTYEGVAPYILTGYPVAAQAVLGITAPLGLVDLAWLYQPLLSFAGVLLCLSLVALVARYLRHRWQTALVGFAGAQPALVYGYALQGSIKEVCVVAVLTCMVALAIAAIHERRPARSLVVLGVGAAAALATLGPAAVAFLAVCGVVVLAVWGRRIAFERAGRELGWLVVALVVAVVLSLPVLTSLGTTIRVNGATLDAATATTRELQFGNLAAPLELVQALGVWFSGDYRYHTLDVTLGTLQDAALWLTAALALLGLAWAVRRRAGGPLLLAASTLPAIYLLARGNAYADAKVLMLVSPAILLLALLGAITLWTGRWRPLSFVLTGSLLAAVASSTAFAYHDVSLLPHDRYEEMLSLGKRLDGRGPVLLNEYDEFAKYFLSAAMPYNEPESDHDYRGAPYHPNARDDPRRRPGPKTPLDMDDLQLRYVERFPFVIVRRGPASSRPPANYRRSWEGTFYELWRRDDQPQVLRHVPLGRDVLRPSGNVSAARARALAATARRLRGHIAYAPRPRMPMYFISHHPRSPRWAGFGPYPGGLVTDGPGRSRGPVSIRGSGRYRVWVEGSFARRLTLRIDGRVIGVTPRELNGPGAYSLIATLDLRRGDHGVEVSQGGGDLRPGNGGYRSSLRHIGPILFEPVASDPRPVRVIVAGNWRELVGIRSDWLEIVRP
jgi:hypothetical protein